MTDQQTTHAANSQAVNIFYTKKILEDFEPKTVFYSLAPVKEPIPTEAGKTIEFTRYLKVPYLFGDNADEFTAQQLYLSASTVSAVIHSRDGFVQLSRLAVLTQIGKVLDRAMENVKTAAARTLDVLVRNDIGFCVADKAVYSANMFNNMGIDGGTLNTSGKTVRMWTRRNHGFPMYHDKARVAQSSLVSSIAASGMTVKTLQNAVSVLEGNDVPALSNGRYQLICHTNVAYQMVTGAGFKGWLSQTTAEPMKASPSEVGIVANVKVNTTTLAWKFPLSADTMSTASGNLYASLLFGQEAYGVSEISGNGRGFQFFLKESGPQTTSDPTNRKKQAAFSIDAVGMVLNKSAGLFILTTGL